MTYNVAMTSKGTVTVPAKIRQQLGMRPGMLVTFQINEATGNAEIVKPVDLDDLRRRTQAHLKKQGFTPQKLKKMAQDYQSGDGFTAHVNEKHQPHA